MLSAIVYFSKQTTHIVKDIEIIFMLMIIMLDSGASFEMAEVWKDELDILKNPLDQFCFVFTSPTVSVFMLHEAVQMQMR